MCTDQQNYKDQLSVVLERPRCGQTNWDYLECLYPHAARCKYRTCGMNRFYHRRSLINLLKSRIDDDIGRGYAADVVLLQIVILFKGAVNGTTGNMDGYIRLLKSYNFCLRELDRENEDLKIATTTTRTHLYTLERITEVDSGSNPTFINLLSATQPVTPGKATTKELLEYWYNLSFAETQFDGKFNMSEFVNLLCGAIAKIREANAAPSEASSEEPEAPPKRRKISASKLGAELPPLHMLSIQ